MAGKRKSGRGFAGQYTVESVDFWWTDPRIRGTAATVKVFLFFANQAAVKERRETLPQWYSSRIIGDLCDLDPKTSAKCLQVLTEKSLLKIEEDGRITVCGVKKRHSNLAWKDGPYIDPNADANAAQAVSDKRLRDETRAEGAVSRVAPIPSPPRDDFQAKLLADYQAKKAAKAKASAVAI